MTVSEITSIAIERGLINPVGSTPEATMSAVLYTYARDHPEGHIVRLFVPGAHRARRGSVRWRLKSSGPLR